jgi:hypothetical protein
MQVRFGAGIFQCLPQNRKKAEKTSFCKLSEYQESCKVTKSGATTQKNFPPKRKKTIFTPAWRKSFQVARGSRFHQVLLYFAVTQ